MWVVGLKPIEVKVSLSLHSLPSLKEAGVMASMLAPMRLMDLVAKVT